MATTNDTITVTLSGYLEPGWLEAAQDGRAVLRYEIDDDGQGGVVYYPYLTPRDEVWLIRLESRNRVVYAVDRSEDRPRGGFSFTGLNGESVFQSVEGRYQLVSAANTDIQGHVRVTLRRVS